MNPLVVGYSNFIEIKLAFLDNRFEVESSTQSQIRCKFELDIPGSGEWSVH